MSNSSTYEKHVTAATIMNAAELIANVVAKVAGSDVSTINPETGSHVSDPDAVQNAVLKIQAHLSHVIN